MPPVLCIGRTWLSIALLALLPGLARGDAIRASYFYSYMDADHVDSLASAGFDRAVVKCPYDSITARAWTEIGRLVDRAPALGVEIVPAWSLQAPSRLASLSTTRRYTWGAGTVENDVGCPLDSIFWRTTLRDRIAETLAAFPTLRRLAFDLEIYAGSRAHYDAGACRCAGCLADFTRAGVGFPSLEAFEESRIADFLEPLLREVAALKPGLEVGFFDLDFDSFVHRAVARATARAGLATVNYTERTYSAGDSGIAAARGALTSLGLTVPIVAGLKLKSFTPASLVSEVPAVLAGADGYFVFTSFSLWNPAELTGQYVLAGSPADYWEALRDVNLVPAATIVQPGSSSVVTTGQTTVVSGAASDPRDPPNAIAYRWEATLLDHGAVVSTNVVTGASGSFVLGTSGNGTGLTCLLRLIVTNTSGLRDTATRTLAVIDPAPAFTSGPSATPGLGTGVVRWTASEPVLGAVRYGRTTALGDSVLASWATSHAITLPGLKRGTKYYYRATSRDGVGQTTVSSLASFTTTANRSPGVVLIAAPASGLAPLAVTFNAAGSTDPDGDALTYAWSFGDGTTASGGVVAHTFGGAGAYPVAVTATDGWGGSATKSVTVTATLDPALPFPTTAVLDTFNRANGVLASPWAGSVSALGVRSNALAPTSTSSSAPVWNGAVFGPNQEAWVTLQAITTTAAEHDLLLKCQGTSTSSGAVQVRYDARVRTITVSTYSSSTGWRSRGTIAQTLVAGDRFGARADAMGNVIVYRNATKLGTVSITGWSSYAKGGRIGLAFVGASASRADDFGGGTVVMPAPATAAIASAPPAGASEDAATPRASASSGSRDDAQRDRALPARVELSAAFPNPSRGGVRLALGLPRRARVAWTIDDLQGRDVWSESVDRDAGRFTLEWSGRAVDGRDLPAGVYVVRVEIDGQRFKRRFTLLR